MAKQTTKGKKSRSAARFGPRYGRKSRKLVADIEEKAKALYDCPQCGRAKVKRESSAIWSCRKCGYTFAGGTYTPETSLGRSVARSVRRALGEEQ